MIAPEKSHPVRTPRTMIADRDIRGPTASRGPLEITMVSHRPHTPCPARTPTARAVCHHPAMTGTSGLLVLLLLVSGCGGAGNKATPGGGLAMQGARPSGQPGDRDGDGIGDDGDRCP